MSRKHPEEYGNDTLEERELHCVSPGHTGPE